MAEQRPFSDVLPRAAGGARGDEAYWRYLLRQCREHRWRQQRHYSSFSSAADWQQHCDGVRRRFRASLGPLPERTPLNPRVTGRLERDGYTVEKLLLESQPGFFVTANLYLPAPGRFPAPAILNPVGHWPHGKAEDLVQARGIGLARHGYVALIYDPVGQGERSQEWDHLQQRNPQPAATRQHAAAGLPCTLIGQSILNHMLWDGVRMLDYLESRPEADADRIGCTGASGGGYQTMFLNALDPRIKVAVPVCSTATQERMLAQGQIGDPCHNPHRTYPDDLDMADLLMCAAPNAVQVIAATYDFFPLIGAREVYLDLQRCYQALGLDDRTQLVEVPAHHDYNQPMREAAYAWFNRWLGLEADPAEAPWQPEPPERLWATTTGQVLTALGGETVRSLNRRRAPLLVPPDPELPDAAAAVQYAAAIRAAVPAVLGNVGTPAAGVPRLVGTGLLHGLRAEQVVFDSEPDLPIPGVVLVPDAPAGGRSVLFLDDRGKGPELEADGLAVALARAGCLVASFDLRGWGETAWWTRFPHEPDDTGLLGNDSLLSYVGYLLGEPALSQRVRDARRCLEYLRSRPEVDPTRLTVVGRGTAGIVALHAAFHPIRPACSIVDSLGTYRSIVESDRDSLPPSAFLPGVLLRYDLPALAGALAPRPLSIANPHDALGQPLSQAVAEATYRLTRRMYGALNAGPCAISSELRREQLIAWLVTQMTGA
jgi:cephalosporin-C deacetylase-like acetyl esterase